MFRAKDGNDEWRYGFLASFDFMVHRIQEQQPDPLSSNQEFRYYASLIPVKSETVGRDVDMRDINGTPMYEGDIIEAWEYEDSTKPLMITINDISDITYWQLANFWKLIIKGSIHDNKKP